MALVARVRIDGRHLERVAADRGATLRDVAQRPIDIVIQNLSAIGFGMTTAEDMKVGSFFDLQFAGLANRNVRVLRRVGLDYGCEFAPPLNQRELALVLEGGSVVDAAFAARDAWRPFMANAQGWDVFKPSPLLRAGVIVGTIAILWIGIIGVADRLVK